MKQAVLALFAFSLLLCGCAVAPRADFAPPPAGLFGSYKAPLLIDYDRSAVTRGSGDASAEYLYVPFTYGILSFAWNDCSLNTASENGRFGKIGAADYEVLNILGLYAKTTVHVYEAPAIAK